MYIQGFDGLRALAMILVFFTHKTAWGADAQIGFSGVWVFFLLSGFLIAGQLGAARHRIESGDHTLRAELGSFWLKRMMRIFPAYYVLILLLVPFYLMSGREIPGLSYYLTYLSNLYFQDNQADFLTTWAHFWSLAVEEQYYIVFAPLMLLVPSRHASNACIFVITAAVLQRFSLAKINFEPYVIYVDSLVNFGLLALGGLLHFQRDRVVRTLRRSGLDHGAVGWLAALAVVVSAPLSKAIAGPNLIVLQICYVVAALFAGLLLMNVYANQGSGFVRILQLRPIAYFGRISYGLYLYNDYVKNDIPERILRAVSQRIWPSGQLPAGIATLLQDGTVGQTILSLAGLFTCFCVLVAVAHLSWTVIEKPALRLRGQIVTRLRTSVDKGGPAGVHVDVAA